MEPSGASLVIQVFSQHSQSEIRSNYSYKIEYNVSCNNMREYCLNASDVVGKKRGGGNHAKFLHIN